MLAFLSLPRETQLFIAAELGILFEGEEDDPDEILYMKILSRTTEIHTAHRKENMRRRFSALVKEYTDYGNP